MPSFIEAGLQRFFGNWGTQVSQKPWRLMIPVLIAVVGIGLGVLALQRENDALDLWVSDRGRIHKEQEFYEDAFDDLSMNPQAIIVQPKRKGDKAVSLLSPEVLDEVAGLQKWVLEYPYTYKPAGKEEVQVTLADFCFKPVDKDDREPCFQYSVLDCFSEGNVFTPGGTKNRAFAQIYSPREPYSTFDFKEKFTESYVREKCIQWYNLGTADTMFLGGVQNGKNSKNETTVADVKALRIVFGTKNEAKLSQDGLKTIIFEERESSGATGLDLCNDALDCDECIEEVGVADAAAAGCQPNSGAQEPRCCEFMQRFRDSPCLPKVFEAQPGLASLGNLVFQGCEIPTLKLEGDVSKQDGSEGEDEVQPVCVCLADRSSEECQEAAADFADANPEYIDTFRGAQGGDEEAVAELGNLLLNEVGCPLGGAAPEEDSEETGIPEICICVTQRDSNECAAAGQAFIVENPQYLQLFLNARNENATAIQRVGQILVQDLNCPLERRRRRRRSLLQEQSGGDSSLPKVCSCLKNPRSQDCSDGGQEFVQANPSYLSLFAAARDGNATASAEVAKIIQEEGGCEQTVKRYRAVLRNTDVGDEDAAWDLLHGWEKAWRRDIKNYAKTLKHIDVAWFTSSTLDDETEKAASAQGMLIVVGYILVGLYIILYFSFDLNGGVPGVSSVPPGPFFALMGYLCILIGVFTTFGIIGLVSMSSMKTSPITLQIVPLLMVGLGVNDFFVIASYLKKAILSSPSPPLTKVLYDTMAGSGTSITLSSLTNVAAFALGALSPIPAVQWFSIHMMIGVVVAYAISILLIPGILRFAVSRYLNGEADFFLPVIGKPKPLPDTVTPEASNKSKGSEFFPRMLSLAVFAFCAFWLSVSIWGIVKLDLGLPGSQIVPKDGDTFRYLVPSEDYFQTFPIYLVYKKPKDVSSLEAFSNIRQTEYEFVTGAYKMDVKYKTTSWLNYYTDYVQSSFCSGGIKEDEVEWYRDGFFTEEFGTEDICKGRSGGAAACKKTCRERCPQGPVGSKFRCQLSNKNRSCFCPYRPKLKEEFFFEVPESRTGTESHWVDFLDGTNQGSISKSLIAFDDSTKTERNKYGVPYGFRTLTFVEDVETVNEKLRHLDSGRDIVDNGPVDDGYPFDLVVYGIGEQYKDLGVRVIIAVAITLGVTLFVMMPLIVHWFAAVIVSGCVLSAVVLTAGTAHWFDIGLNHSLYVSLVVAVGLSVEFCVHITRDFMVSPGSSRERVFHSLHSLGFAVFNGGITTFLGILPVAWADYNYFRKYFFGLYSIVVAVGLFVGLFFLPSVLYWIGPHSCPPSATKKGVDEEKNTEMAKRP